MRTIKFRRYLGSNMHYTDEMDTTLMQFTNCYDRNGTPIYEGDFLQYRNDNGYGHSHSKLKLVTYSVTSRTNGFNIAQGDNYEVVGNIYENPELKERV